MRTRSQLAEVSDNVPAPSCSDVAGQKKRGSAARRRTNPVTEAEVSDNVPAPPRANTTGSKKRATAARRRTDPVTEAEKQEISNAFAQLSPESIDQALKLIRAGLRNTGKQDLLDSIDAGASNFEIDELPEGTLRGLLNLTRGQNKEADRHSSRVASRGASDSSPLASLPYEILFLIFRQLDYVSKISFAYAWAPMYRSLSPRYITTVYRKKATTKRKVKALLTLGKLPTEIWNKVRGYLSLDDEASLFVSSQFLYARRDRASLLQLHRPSERTSALKFLFRCPELFPDRTLCLPCATYHYDGIDDDEADNYRSEHCPGIQLDSIRWLRWPGPQAESQREAGEHFMFRHSQRKDTDTAWHLTQRSHFPDQNFYTDVNFLWSCEYNLYATMSVLQHPEDVPLPQLCCHAQDAPDIKGELHALLKQLPRPWEEVDKDWDIRGRIWRCTWCPTEYYLVAYKLYSDHTITQERAQFCVMLNRVMDFGNCWSRHSREWKALCSREVPGVIETRVFPFRTEDDESLIELYTYHECQCLFRFPKRREVYPLLTKSTATQLGYPNGLYHGSYTFDNGFHVK